MQNPLSKSTHFLIIATTTHVARRPNVAIWVIATNSVNTYLHRPVNCRFLLNIHVK
ncbi:hypothetical protein HanXRQr2_Chr13g0601181 [Helianthus annuus]|uniref:Uncharacterized protein n=1 Tax=Helianthus annuus TaxID=4232 RepID=A0A9K3EKH8_HELAN|nr:hypothetical protein HanXRQr2_Chr13g0601181 [Helianthus annuus]